MSTRTTIVMGLILMALLALFLMGKKSPDEPGDKPHLFTFSASDVEGITIQKAAPSPAPSAAPSASASPAGGSAQKVSLVRQNGHWLMDAPLQAVASSQDAGTLASDLADLRQEQKTDSRDAGVYGLANPAAVIEIKTKDGNHTIKLGQQTVTNEGYYAQIDNRPDIVVTGQSLQSLVDKAPEAWRDRAPLDIEPGKVSKWSLVHDNQTLTLSKDKDGHWQITQPQAARADNTTAQNLVFQFRNMQVQGFPADVKPDDPRLKPTTTLNVWSGDDKTPQTLTVGSQDPKTKAWYAVRSPYHEVLLLANGSMAPLRKTLGDLQDKHVLSFDPYDATGLTITAHGITVEAKKKDMDWEITRPAGTKDPLHKAGAVVDHVHGMTWKQQLTGKEASQDLGFASPTATVVLTKGDKGEKIGTLEFGKPAPDHGVYARVAEHPETAYVVAETSLTFIQGAVSALTPAAASPSASAAPAAAASASASPSVANPATLLPSPGLSASPR